MYKNVSIYLFIHWYICTFINFEIIPQQKSLDSLSVSRVHWGASVGIQRAPHVTNSLPRFLQDCRGGRVCWQFQFIFFQLSLLRRCILEVNLSVNPKFTSFCMLIRTATGFSKIWWWTKISSTLSKLEPKKKPPKSSLNLCSERNPSNHPTMSCPLILLLIFFLLLLLHGLLCGFYLCWLLHFTRLRCVLLRNDPKKTQ